MLYKDMTESRLRSSLHR